MDTSLWQYFAEDTDHRSSQLCNIWNTDSCMAEYKVSLCYIVANYRHTYWNVVNVDAQTLDTEEETAIIHINTLSDITLCNAKTTLGTPCLTEECLNLCFAY